MTARSLPFETPSIFGYLESFALLFRFDAVRVSRLRPVCLMGAMVMLGHLTETGSVQAQGSETALRMAIAGIAREIVAKVPPDSRGLIAIVVETDQHRSTIENALLHELQENGRSGTIGARGGEGELLQISSVVVEMKGRTLAGGVREQVASVALDARWEKPEEAALFLGRFEQVGLDTVRNDGSDGSAGSVPAMERIVEPLIVIVGAILIVYLFFTVRN